MAARKLGQEQRACAILAPARRTWAAELERVDNGFFSTTPFFISFTDDPAQLRRAQYLYLLALAELFQGRDRRAGELFRESLAAQQRQPLLRIFRPGAVSAAPCFLRSLLFFTDLLRKTVKTRSCRPSRPRS